MRRMNRRGSGPFVRQHWPHPHKAKDPLMQAARDYVMLREQLWRARRRKTRPSDRSAMTVKLTGELRRRLNRMAAATGLTKHAIARRALIDAIDTHEARLWLAGQPPADTEEQEQQRAYYALDARMPGTGVTDQIAWMLETGANPLRAVRAGRGFTLERVATRLADMGLHIDEDYLAQIEDGKVRADPELLAALAKVLGVAPEVLVG